MNMDITTYDTTEDMINKIQELKGETKLKFCENLRNYNDGMNIRNFKFEKEIFSKNVQGTKIHHEVILLMKFLQTKPHVKNMNINYYDLFYTIVKNKENVDDKSEKIENIYISLKDVIIPNRYIGIMGREK